MDSKPLYMAELSHDEMALECTSTFPDPNVIETNKTSASQTRNLSPLILHSQLFWEKWPLFKNYLLHLAHYIKHPEGLQSQFPVNTWVTNSSWSCIFNRLIFLHLHKKHYHFNYVHLNIYPYLIELLVSYLYTFNSSPLVISYLTMS